MYFWIAFGIFFTFLILESVSSWIFIRGSKKHHPELWTHAGEPTLMGNGDMISAWPLNKYLMQRKYQELSDQAAIQFAEQWVWQPNLALSSNKNKDFYFKRDGLLQNLGTTNISYSPSVVGASNLVYAPNTVFRVALLSKYVGEQNMGNIDTDLSKLEAYFTNDINLSYVWTPNSWIKEAQFSLLVNNIFNALYSSNGYFYTFDDDYSVAGVVTTIEGVGYYPQAGTNFLMGATFRF